MGFNSGFKGLIHQLVKIYIFLRFDFYTLPSKRICVYQYTISITLYERYGFIFTHFATLDRSVWSVCMVMSRSFVESNNFVSESCRVTVVCEKQFCQFEYILCVME